MDGRFTLVWQGELTEHMIWELYEHIDVLREEGLKIHQARYMKNGEEVNMLDDTYKPLAPPPDKPAEPVEPQPEERDKVLDEVTLHADHEGKVEITGKSNVRSGRRQEHAGHT